jgi:ABC-type antimicrobial peptide transport system permease subunit
MGLLALTLAAIGISGVFGYVVRQRTREIGIRMALGANAGDVVRLVLGSNLGVLAGGTAAGAGGAAVASIGLAKVLPGVEAADPAAYAGAALLLAAAVIIASAAPVKRATRVDPVRALRYD